ncbi:uncharacterized protein LOC143040756 [Oratosquilla oratoria]|uniref:uncharacterized protein LOC143040756 n=1 Tax=Oratosquilla oratoria TaxID=337810 RepID=UPI003F77598B
MRMSNFSTAATVLALGLWVGGLSCQAQRRCVEVDRVKNRDKSSTVPFRSGMKVEFLHDKGRGAYPEHNTTIRFFILEDEKIVATVFVYQNTNNELMQVKVNFNMDKRGTPLVIHSKRFFFVGILGRVRLEYSGGLFRGVIWNKDRQRNKTWSERAPTMGQGNLTIFARTPNNIYSYVVYWPITCSSAPTPAPDTEDCVSVPVHMGLLTVRAVMTLILLVIVVCLVRLERNVSRASEERRQ